MAHSDELSQAIETLRSQIALIERALHDLRQQSERVDWVTVALAGPAVFLARHEIEEGIAKVEHSVLEALEKSRPFVEHDVPIVSVALTSERWLDHVERPTSQLVQPMGDPNHIVDWSGDANKAYLYRKSLQLQAVNDSVSRAVFVSQWLDGVVSNVAMP